MQRSIIRDTMLLSRKAAPAAREDLHTAADLRDTLMANADRCVGLAANMIGVNKSIIAFMVGGIPVVMLNPKMTGHSKESYNTEEGCLSLDGVRPVSRYNWVRIRFQDMMFKSYELTYSDFTAQVIQHEMDHCSGILI